MIIDHIGLFFFPHLTLMRDIGRISFPLFAWLIANGAHNTSNIFGYLRRLFILALISQIPFTLANQQIGSPLFYLNVLFTLCLGLLAILAIEKNKNIFLQALIVISCSIMATIIHSDYGAAGVLAVVASYIFFKNKVGLFVSMTCIFIALPVMMNVLQKTSTTPSFLFSYISPERYALLALPVIFLYNNKKGYNAKYLFYIIYPLQYIFIFLALSLSN